MPFLTKLKLKNFIVKPISSEIFGSAFYLEAPVRIRQRDCFICLEPCMGGFCVGLYSDNESLVLDKECTRTEIGPDFTARSRNKAIEIANRLAYRAYWDYLSIR